MSGSGVEPPAATPTERSAVPLPEVTFNVNVSVMGVVRPGVVALTVMVLLPTDAPLVSTTSVTFEGAPVRGSTTFDGENWQIVPAGSPLQLSVTLPPNDPCELTWKVMGADGFPSATVTELVESVPSEMLKTCSFTNSERVTVRASLPVAAMLNPKSLVEPLATAKLNGLPLLFGTRLLGLGMQVPGAPLPQVMLTLLL
jgi:hypothetical protein